tara:strand:+ start:122 stop:322 length:201 start_codon:yes stop_codon:yes gene_type:complete
MKTLELNQMELIEGGLNCGSTMGLAAAGLLAGFLVAATGPVGWGLALYFGSAGAIWANGVFNCGAE